MKKIVIAACATGLSVVALAGCNGNNSAVNRDQRASASILNQYEQAQPAPKFPWSQIRQTAIDIETAQAKTTQTTSFFFNQGVTNPVQSCPSIGFPVATTTQLTNPLQSVNTNYHDSSVVAQIDPNGVYTGDSTGTYVLCVDSKGDTYGVYWEGFVYTATGPAVWDGHAVQMTGPSSFDFKTGK